MALIRLANVRITGRVESMFIGRRLREPERRAEQD
jgi:hypothetical protein